MKRFRAAEATIVGGTILIGVGGSIATGAGIMGLVVGPSELPDAPFGFIGMVTGIAAAAVLVVGTVVFAAGVGKARRIQRE